MKGRLVPRSGTEVPVRGFLTKYKGEDNTEFDPKNLYPGLYLSTEDFQMTPHDSPTSLHSFRPSTSPFLTGCYTNVVSKV